MVDKIRKLLRQLSVREQRQLAHAIRLVASNDFRGLDVKKLKGRDDVFRVRKGKFRIIFRKIEDADPMIIAIERRSDTTYNTP